MTVERKRVSVSFVGDGDVVKHIIPINERKTRLREKDKRKTKSVNYCDAEEEEYYENEDVFKPSEALVGEKDLAGGEVFGFKSNKMSKQMAQKASDSANAVTPSTPKSASHTPRSILKNTPKSAVDSGTPKRSLRLSKRKLEATTPFRLKARNRFNDSSSEEESVSEEETESDSDGYPTASPSPSAKRPQPKTPKTPAGRKKQRLREEDDDDLPADSAEQYFDLHSSAAVTSDHTLSKLDTPRMDQEAITAALSGVSLAFGKERKALYEEHRQLFHYWMFNMCNGYNLLLHGVGSKRRLIEDFRLTMLRDFTHVVVNGYFPSITIKNILNSITEDILEHSGSFHSLTDHCEFIRKHYECGDYEDFYLVIHNIDGAMLRAEKVQMLLSLLSQISGFHIIASIDHINAPLIWDQAKSSRFNWLWYDVTMYDPYTEETSYENSLLVQQSGVLALSSLTHVMKSLTPNAKGIFFLLAKYQIENAENQTYNGLAFPDLYQRCREAFLVNSDLTLRTQLTEFRDHKLIRFKKLDGVEYLIIPLDLTMLKEFIQTEEEA